MHDDDLSREVLENQDVTTVVEANREYLGRM
jgi:hypothetical protein